MCLSQSEKGLYFIQAEIWKDNSISRMHSISVSNLGQKNIYIRYFKLDKTLYLKK